MAGIHHVEIWVDSRDEALREWGWILAAVGFTRVSAWVEGESWAAGGSYLSITTSPNTVTAPHDRRRPGVNHVALEGGTRARVDDIMAAAPDHGWRPLYAERYPHAGGPDHYAGWLENSAGFKVEIVATDD